MKIIIRRTTPSDAAALLEHLRQIGGETDNLSFGSEGLPFSIEDEMSFLEGIQNSTDHLMLLAIHDGKIIGDASLSRSPRRMSHRGDLGISVQQSHWNQGIGGMLMKEVIQFAKKNAYEVIDLQVRSDNHSAIHLYKKFGFKKIGTHPSFFKINNQNISFDYMYLAFNESNEVSL